MSSQAISSQAMSGADLRALINGFQISRAIHVAVQLDLPERLRAAPATAATLAVAVGADAGALARLLRALAAAGLLHEADDGRFRLTPLGCGLCEEAHAAWTRLVAGPEIWAGWGALLHAVRTGETGFGHAHGCDVWEFRARDPEAGRRFDRAMGGNSAVAAGALATAFDFAGFRRLVDVGGGDGALLAGLLAGHPACTGILLDRPHVVGRAGEVLAAAGVAGRCRIVAGDFFAAVPGGGDAYLLKSILHDWDDADAARILAACRAAMPPDAVLLVVERVLAPANAGLEGRLSDLNMLVNTGGRERTEAEFAALLRAGGFMLDRVVPTTSHLSLLLARPGAAVSNQPASAASWDSSARTWVSNSTA